MNELPRTPGDFGAACLTGACVPDPGVMLRDAVVHGLPKSASYLLATFRDDTGTLFRCLRALGAQQESLARLLTTMGGGQLERELELEPSLTCDWSTIERVGEAVEFTGGLGERSSDDRRFQFVHSPAGARWSERDVFDVEARLLGPGMQWFNPRRDGGGCYAAAFYYRAHGTYLGRVVDGFFVHEIHYLPDGTTWMTSPYSLEGIEVVWQHAATAYEDGTTTYGSFGYGVDGWGFAMVFAEDGAFEGTRDVDVEVTLTRRGFPATVSYQLPREQWCWTIDPHGERGELGTAQLVGAEGTWQRVGDTRRVVASLGNSDWWLDGRGDHVVTQR